MKQKFLLFIALSLCLVLNACSWLTNKTEENPPTDTNMICANIGREMLEAQSYQQVNATTRSAQLYKEYQRYGCDKKSS